MRIGIVSPNPALNSGGVERFCHTLCTCLASLGASAEVIGLSDAARFNADLLVTNGMVGTATGAARVHVYHGCWVEHVRNSHPEASRQWRTRFLLVGVARELWAGRRAYRVAVSQSAADEISRWYRYSIQQIVPNGVDTAQFSPGDRNEARRAVGRSPAERIALFIGRAESRKRPDIAALAASQAGYQLFVAGSGSVRDAVMLGNLSPTSLATWIRAADCVLAPSQYEACSLAILEAFAVGTPVIATQVGWIYTLLAHVPSYAELTAPRGDTESFTQALRNLTPNSEAVAAAVAHVRANNSLEAFRDRWRLVVEDATKRKQWQVSV